MKSILNWDDEIHPTPLENLFENICLKVESYTGRNARVCVEKGRTLRIETFVAPKSTTHISELDLVWTDKRAGYWETSVALNLYNYGEEIVGRLHHILPSVGRVELGCHVDKAMASYR